MIIAVLQNNLLIRLHLSSQAGGNYIIHDTKGNVIGNIVFEGDKYLFYANKNINIINAGGESTKSATITNYSSLNIEDISTKEKIQLYFYPAYVPNTTEFEVKKNEITVGKAQDCDLTYSSPYIMDHQYKLTYKDSSWYLESLDGYVFVNDKLVKRKRIKHGDIIFSFGLKVVCINNTIIASNLLANTTLTPNANAFNTKKRIAQKPNADAMDKEGDKEVFDAKDEFFRSPRFKSEVEEQTVNLVPPPQFNQEKTKPAILTLGPQMTMMVTSVVTMSTTVMNIGRNGTTLESALPGLLLSVFTMVSSFLWPYLSTSFDKFERRKDKATRIKEYKRYLEEKDKEYSEIIESQKQILLENSVSLEQCQEIIYGRKRNLWEKTINDNDFLSVRIGTGYVQPKIKADYDEKAFASDDTMLAKDVKALINKYKYIEDMPLNTSFLEKRVSAIIGNPGILKSFFEGLLLQLMTFHIYSELKIVIFTNEKNVNEWDYMKFSPYCWDNSHTFRFIASTIDDKKRLSQYLENVINERMGALGDSKGEEGIYRKFLPYYLVITDDIEFSRNLEAVNSILKMPANLGFSMIIKHNRIANLPSECSTFYNITDGVSGMFTSNLTAENQNQFKADLNKTVNVEECVRELSNIYVKIPLDKHELPKSVGFLDMYGVGNVQQLNSLDRWQSNNPVNSLAVPVGIDQSGELFQMDIHEKAYGPHGLVAGTTGSGKSEWIITYILSLCVNFSPEEVQFVLIDYKGGGLAGSFENRETGMHLPHLVGTITNLDKSEIRRSLASLEAESKRRQQMFNEARDKLNDSSMNIYKYQQYYRKGMVDEPLSHLLIISDEFAELKAQEPEFLDQLVSIARIGRSLGIHLILATQKPSGVVNDQMWSNSRFKVCLRVQDKSDSVDMIKCDDAAYLKQTGAFYFQVGLNEYFALGQSAYAGGKYEPTSIVKKKIETSVDLLNESGDVINSVDYVKQDNEEQFKDVHGEELLNIILYVSDISKDKNFKIRPLWLDPIPGEIYIDDIKKKYGFKRQPYNVRPVIGVYDNPYNQSQFMLDTNLVDTNTIIFGSPGMGKEMYLQSIIYSIITNYTPQEVNLYIMDFGAETLGMFANAPHVGDVVYQTDIEKINNLIKMLRGLISERKQKYKDIGGTYISNIKYGEQKEPLIVVIINQANFLKENLGDLFDVFQSLYAEAIKYGITFIETSSDKILHRDKVMQTFGNVYSLRLADDDYTSFFGSAARGIIPKNITGRGLCEIDGVVYEFQTCQICSEDKLQPNMLNICKKLSEAYKFKANPIPMIPKAINLDTIDKDFVDIFNICVGYSKLAIQPIYLDLDANTGVLVLGDNRQALSSFTDVLVQEMDVVASKGPKIYLYDSLDLFGNYEFGSLKYYGNSDIVGHIDSFIKYLEDEKAKYDALENKNEYTISTIHSFIFNGVYNILNLLDEEKRAHFNELLAFAHDAHLINVIMIDMINDYKEVQREEGVYKMVASGTAVLMGNTYDNQSTIPLNTQDVRLRDGLGENEGFIVINGRGFYSQVLQAQSNEQEF